MQEQELAKQNQKLDQLSAALDTLHNTSKAVGDTLEEQITLIEQLEENTDRAHAATRSLRRNLRHHMENDGLLQNKMVDAIVILALLFLILVLVYLLLR